MVLAAVTVVGAGAVAASLTGVLPLSTERPVPRPAVSAPPTSASVESGNLPAAYGLCRAFDRAAQRGDDIATAQAFRNLAHAAGGASRVSAYCAPFQSLDPGRAR
jgi:DNA primase